MSRIDLFQKTWDGGHHGFSQNRKATCDRCAPLSEYTVGLSIDVATPPSTIVLDEFEKILGFSG